jgi:hypothetical protein
MISYYKINKDEKRLELKYSRTTTTLKKECSKYRGCLKNEF